MGQLFKNDLGDWIRVQAYPGSPNQPFAEETIDIETAPNGGGRYFHGQFQVRFCTTGSSGTFPNDDWFVDDISLSTPVGIAELPNVPLEFAVKQNYPNPFNPVTTIEYQLPQSSEVTLLVYNVLGQKVRTLLNRPVEAGYHKISWDGSNDSGQPVASGTQPSTVKPTKAPCSPPRAEASSTRPAALPLASGGAVHRVNHIKLIKDGKQDKIKDIGVY